ncbi:MAG: tRNA uridine-5-carboxymethylaminomethyl(34) synthesis GTPase MnmE [Caldithrix sp.]|nr:MAG: tRNA uridine-5-carboxymethylaminomethyl(34) synthesis GTPase MnmE [Caldithrix sp.]
MSNLKKMIFQNETIAAISTPAGSGGIAVVRISGSSAISIVDKVFQGKVRLSQAESHKVLLGKIGHPLEKDGGFLDEALVTVFGAPNSYTAEDVVEISCHGGHYLTHRILALVVENGARLAEPGEFTQRAFLSGRLDLSQAEAVADIIRAKTDLSLKAALSQFQGALSKRVKEMRKNLIEICSLLELELDFAEEDVEFASKDDVENRLGKTIKNIEDFLQTYKRGKILREGAKLVIAGKPNVGKSSLLNALLKEERAIVTEIPGTTRDVLEEQLDIRGVLFRVVDTAGVRVTKDKIEQLGVQRSLEQIKEADILLFLFDGSSPLDQQDLELIEHVLSLRKRTEQDGLIVAINKVDLKKKLSSKKIKELLEIDEILEISAKEHQGLKELESVFLKQTIGKETLNGEPVVTNIRQKQALGAAIDALRAAQTSLKRGLSSEFVAVDLRQALDHLGEIIGEVTSEDILGNIFSKFCIGK